MVDIIKINKTKQIMMQFSENPKEMQEMQEKLDSGWGIVNLIAHNLQYLAILEELNHPEDPKDIKVFIPARTKIQLC